MGHWLNKQLKALGVTTVLKDLGPQTLQGQRLDLPPAILGKLGENPKKKTVLIYGHYDVQPVSCYPMCLAGPVDMSVEISMY
jgi:Cys-Gly metallodipeptidase DUG1